MSQHGRPAPSDDQLQWLRGEMDRLLDSRLHLLRQELPHIVAAELARSTGGEDGGPRRPAPSATSSAPARVWIAYAAIALGAAVAGVLIGMYLIAPPERTVSPPNVERTVSTPPAASREATAVREAAVVVRRAEREWREQLVLMGSSTKRPLERVSSASTPAFKARLAAAFDDSAEGSRMELDIAVGVIQQMLNARRGLGLTVDGRMPWDDGEPAGETGEALMAYLRDETLPTLKLASGNLQEVRQSIAELAEELQKERQDAFASLMRYVALERLSVLR